MDTTFSPRKRIERKAIDFNPITQLLKAIVVKGNGNDALNLFSNLSTYIPEDKRARYDSFLNELKEACFAYRYVALTSPDEEVYNTNIEDTFRSNEELSAEFFNIFSSYQNDISLLSGISGALPSLDEFLEKGKKLREMDKKYVDKNPLKRDDLPLPSFNSPRRDLDFSSKAPQSSVISAPLSASSNLLGALSSQKVLTANPLDLPDFGIHVADFKPEDLPKAVDIIRTIDRKKVFSGLADMDIFKPYKEVIDTILKIDDNLVSGKWKESDVERIFENWSHSDENSIVYKFMEIFYPYYNKNEQYRKKLDDKQYSDLNFDKKDPNLTLEELRLADNNIPQFLEYEGITDNKEEIAEKISSLPEENLRYGVLNLIHVIRNNLEEAEAKVARFRKEKKDKATEKENLDRVLNLLEEDFRTKLENQKASGGLTSTQAQRSGQAPKPPTQSGAPKTSKIDPSKAKEEEEKKKKEEKERKEQEIKENVEKLAKEREEKDRETKRNFGGFFHIVGLNEPKDESDHVNYGMEYAKISLGGTGVMTLFFFNPLLGIFLGAIIFPKIIGAGVSRLPGGSELAKVADKLGDFIGKPIQNVRKYAQEGYRDYYNEKDSKEAERLKKMQDYKEEKKKFDIEQAKKKNPFSALSKVKTGQSKSAPVNSKPVIPAPIQNPPSQPETPQIPKASGNANLNTVSAPRSDPLPFCFHPSSNQIVRLVNKTKDENESFADFLTRQSRASIKNPREVIKK